MTRLPNFIMPAALLPAALARGPARQDDAVADLDAPVADLQRALRGLLDHDQRGAGLVHPRQGLVHTPADRLGQPEAGLVHGQDLRAGGQAAGDRHHLLLAAGQGARRLAQVRPQVGEQVEGPAVGIGPAGLPGAAGPAVAAEHDVVRGRQVRVELPPLRDQGQAPARGPHHVPGRRGRAEDRDLAAPPGQPHDPHQQAALAVAVRPDDRDRLPRPDAEGRVAHGHEVPVGHRHAGHAQRCIPRSPRVCLAHRVPRSPGTGSVSTAPSGSGRTRRW